MATDSLDTGIPMGLERLKMSELMERARAFGAPNDVIDECMDQPDPRAALIAMLLAAPNDPASEDEASLSSQLYDMAQTLAGELQQLALSPDRSQNDGSVTDIVTTVHAMIEFCSSAAAEMEIVAVDEVQQANSAEHMLATGGVVEVCTQLLHASLPSGSTPRAVFSVDERPPVAQAATLLLSTLAAQRDAHAWFSGSGAIPALVAALSYGLGLAGDQQEASGRLLPPDEHGADGAVEPLAAASLANLAWHDGALGASSAVAKEMLRVGAVGTLLATLVRGHLRSVQWAAAALCNLSMHGDKARAELAACGTCEAVAKSITRLSAASVSETTASANSITKDTSAVAEARSVALELLLGAMSNLAPYSTEDVLELSLKRPLAAERLVCTLSCQGGAIDAALSVLSECPIHTPRGANTHAVYSAASSLITETIDASSRRPSSGRPSTAQDSRVSGNSSRARQPLSATASTIHGFEYSGDGSTSLSGSSAIGEAVSFTEASDGDLHSGGEAISVMLTHPRLVNLPSRLAEIAARRPGSARVVTPLRKHVDTLIEHETGLPPQETPEEYAERVEQERKEEEELLQRLKEEEEEALREEARIAEEEAAMRRAEEEVEAARSALEESQAAAAGILGTFSSTAYQLRYNASVVVQREWRRKLAVREVDRLHNAAEVRRREQQIQAQKDAIKLRETQAREAKLAAARMAREKAALERAKVDEGRAQAEALLSLDVSSLTGSDLVHMISKRSATRANLAPYSWGDLNEVAGPRTLGRADRARNDELARVAALLQDDDSLAFLVKSSASNVKNK